MAMERGDLEEVAMLLRELLESEQDQQNKNQITVRLLCKAVHLGDEDMVELLLKSDPDASASSLAEGEGVAVIESFPPLHLCILSIALFPNNDKMATRKRILQLLVENGIPVDQKDRQGKTAMDRAIEWGAPQIAEDLKGMVLALKEKEVLALALPSVPSITQRVSVIEEELKAVEESDGSKEASSSIPLIGPKNTQNTKGGPASSRPSSL